MIGAYGSHDGCREALHGSCMLLQPSQSLYFSFVQIKVHFSDVTEDFKCRTLKIATWCGLNYCIQIKSRIQPLGILSFLLHDAPNVRDGLDGWTGLDYELGDLGVDRIFYMCLYSRYVSSGWALTYLPDSPGKLLNGIKMQVVPLKIRFKSCRIALDNEIDYDVKGSGSRTIDVGGWGGTWIPPKP